MPKIKNQHLKLLNKKIKTFNKISITADLELIKKETKPQPKEMSLKIESLANETQLIMINHSPNSNLNKISMIPINNLSINKNNPQQKEV